MKTRYRQLLKVHSQDEMLGKLRFSIGELLLEMLISLILRVCDLENIGPEFSFENRYEYVCRYSTANGKKELTIKINILGCTLKHTQVDRLAIAERKLLVPRNIDWWNVREAST